MDDCVQVRIDFVSRFSRLRNINLLTIFGGHLCAS